MPEIHVLEIINQSVKEQKGPHQLQTYSMERLASGFLSVCLFVCFARSRLKWILKDNYVKRILC